MNMMNKYVDLEKVVEEPGLASTMKSGSLAVLATPQLAAWMEEAACACIGQANDLTVEPEEQEAMTSVGTKLNLDHLKASPPGRHDQSARHADQSRWPENGVLVRSLAGKRPDRTGQSHPGHGGCSEICQQDLRIQAVTQTISHSKVSGFRRNGRDTELFV